MMSLRNRNYAGNGVKQECTGASKEAEKLLIGRKREC